MYLNEILEWQAILALQGYLRFTLPGPVDSGVALHLDEAAILMENARAAFEFELTNVFARPRLVSPIINPSNLETYRQKLSELLILLDSLAWPAPAHGHSGQFLHIFGNINTPCDRLWYLLDHLETIRLPLNLIRGPFGPAFRLPNDDDLARHLKTVMDVNTFLDSLPSPSSADTVGAVLKRDPEFVDSGVRDDVVGQFASTAFHTVFDRLGSCTTAHTAMLYLRRQYGDNVTPEPQPLLDMFISSCPKHTAWREIQCCCPTSSDEGQCTARDVKNLCTLINEKKRQCLTLHALGNELRNATKGAPRARHGRDVPGYSLRSLISRDAFKPPNIKDPVSARFNRTEKRNLVQDIVRAFSYLSGSGWVGRGWCSKNLFFLKETLDKTRSRTPFGPYVTCSAEGPPLEDMDRWAPNLDDPPILLFLAKLLLEIDLGVDLEDDIEEKLSEDDEETLCFLLWEIYDLWKWDLDYGDAIETCLRYHVERQVKVDQGEIPSGPGHWSEWDRRYVRGVLKKLEDTSAEIPWPGEQGYKQSWRTSRSPPPGPESQRPIFDSSSDTGYPHSNLGASLLQPSQAGSTARTSFDNQPPMLEPQTTRLLRDPSEATRKLARTQTQIPSSLSGWLDAADESVADPKDPQDSLDLCQPFLSDDDEQGVGVLFDTTEDYNLHDHQKEYFPKQHNASQKKRFLTLSRKAQQAEEFWAFMRDFNKRHLPPDVGTSQPVSHPRRVKIALIDTGIDFEDPLICLEHGNGRIRGRSWVGDELDLTDTWGHGTHLARMVLKTSRTAEILVAKVSETQNFRPETLQNIVEAIDWAIAQDADIISLSLGFKKPDQDIEAALSRAVNPKGPADGTRPRLVFAAAANWGFNRGLAFPASMRGVICVHATSGNGYDGQINPGTSSSRDHQNFSIGTLGITIESLWRGKRVWLKGTSYSTPIAAAVAANILDLARRQPGISDALGSYRGMKAVMALMCTDNHSGSYPYFAPWLVYEKHVDKYSCEKIKTTDQICKAIKACVDSLPFN